MTWWLVVIAVVATIFTIGFFWLYAAGAWGLMTVASWFWLTIPERSFDNVMALTLALWALAWLLPWGSGPRIRFSNQAGVKRDV